MTDGSLAASSAKRLLELGLLAADEPDEDLPALEAGQMLDNYRLIKKLGEGGFGVVWQAEQERPIRRMVAVKIVRTGLDSRSVLQRFQAEQRALERLHHVNIASVLDSGVCPQGRPYVVLELVRGEPIHTYCHSRSLSLRERLEIFCSACQGVQHAHQRAVLHRDLKPSNVLVEEIDGRGVAKVIDFGIAKALSEDADGRWVVNQTMDGVLLGTPQYMAPEQANAGADAIDARVDVYALGAILYELLTGAPPHDVARDTPFSISGFLRRVDSEQPQRPSARVRARTAAGKATPGTSHQLRGDLDWIVLKALEKEPHLRYQSASGLAEDIQRYLLNEPITARPPDPWYRLQKLVKRNPVTVTLSAVVAVNLILLAVVSSIGLIREKAAHAKAEALRELAESKEKDAAMQSMKARALATFLSRLLKQAGAFVESGKNPEALRLAMNQSIASVEAMENQPDLQLELLERLESVYDAMGDGQMALPLVQRQYDIQSGLAGQNDPKTLAILLRLASVTSDVGDKARSLALYEELRQRWLALGPQFPELRTQALHAYARELARQGQGERAFQVAGQAEPLTSGDLTGLRLRADIQTGLGLYVEAERTLQQALTHVERQSPANQKSRSGILQHLSRVEMKQGKLPDAATHLRESLLLEKELRGTGHHSLIAKWIELSRLYVKTGREQAAFAATDRAVRIARANGSEEKLPKALRASAEIREEAGDLQSALVFRMECQKLERESNPDRGKWIYEGSQIIRLHSRLGHHDQALTLVDELWQAILAEPQVRRDQAFMSLLCGIFVDACEKWQEAENSTARAEAIEEWRRIAHD